MKVLAQGVVGSTLAIVVVFLGWHFLHGEPAAGAADAHAQASDAVPVTMVKAKVQDVPDYFVGLGTVQALNVVQIKAQVNGTLIALPAKEGQEVHKGDIVAEIDPRSYQASLDQATAQRDEDTALLSSAEQDLRRYQDLAKRSFAPVQQVDDQLSSVNKQKAAIAADTAAMEMARINLGYCVIHAPIDGRISLYQTDVGNLIEVASQTGIVSITQDHPISVVFTLPENDLPRIQAARAKGEPLVQVVSNDGHAVLATGKLLTPDNTIDTATGTILLKAIFDNNDDRLWPGQFVGAQLLVETISQAVTIPRDALEHGPSGLFVYTVKPDQTAQPVTVEVGYQDDTQVVVTKGLAGNDLVVTGGQSRLSPGMRVKASSVSAPDANSKPPGTSQTPG